MAVLDLLQDLMQWRDSDYRNLKINSMGNCSSPLGRVKRTRREKHCGNTAKDKMKNKERNHESTMKKGQEQPSTESLQGEVTHQVLSCLGEIIGVRLNLHMKLIEEVIGVGCLISTRTLLASDQYLHQYSPTELKFRPFNQSRSKAIKVKQCLYPIIPKEKNRSMFLHKRVSFALFELQSPTTSGVFMQLGINVMQDDEETIVSFDQSPFLSEMIDETSRLLYFQTSQKLQQRGWPLLYKLYDKYYCVGLYSNPYTSDSLLISDRLVQRFKSCEAKHLQTEEITSLEISEAMIEMPVTVKEWGIVERLLEELEEVKNGGDLQQMADATFRIGTEYGILGDLTHQKQYYNIALKHYLACNDQHNDNIAALYHNLGICQSQLNNNTEAYEYLLKSLSLKKSIDDESEAVADTYNQLGVIAKKEAKYEEALNYYYQAYNIYSLIEYPQKMSLVLNNIVLINQQQQTHNTNQTKYRGILGILVKSKGQNCIQVAKVLFNLAKLESQCKNYGNAISYLSKSVNIMKNLQLQDHYQYKKIIKEIEDIDLMVEQYALKKEWIMKSKALLTMI